MTIGEALKKEQEDLGLTAVEMAAGVISKGTYSKVVNNKSRISTDLSLKILFIHEINIEKFFNMTKENYAPKNKVLEDRLSRKFGEAFNNHDLDKVKACLKEIEKLDKNSYLSQRARIEVAFLTKDFEQLDHDFSELIMEELMTMKIGLRTLKH